MDTVVFNCRYCEKKFSKRLSWNRHERYVHKRTAKGETIPDTHKVKFSCASCDKNFQKKSNLQSHIVSIHLSRNDSSVIKHCSLCDFKTAHKGNLKRHMSKIHENNSVRDDKAVYKCSLCSAKYKFLRNLRSHERKIHQKGEPAIVRRKCPLCAFTSYSRSKEAMYTHFENSHGFVMKWESHRFDSISDFNVWKRELEIHTKTSYTEKFRTKRSIVFQCHRCGTYKTKGVGKRQMKFIGSCKINGFCPATVKVQIDESEVKVCHLPIHIGHKNELEYIRLTDEERKSIALQLAAKKPHEEILKGIRESVTTDCLKRIHLINKKDILNIKKSFNLSKGSAKLSFNPVDIDACLDDLKMSKETALLVYKPVGVISEAFPQLCSDDFLLIFMSAAQKMLLEKYNSDTICVDCAYGLTSYNFQLYTLLTTDESREGFPAAFMFTNKVGDCMLETFFNEIKTVTGSITPNVFMSDIMEEALYSIWEKTMGPAKKRIFCTWHVLKAWKAGISSKIKIKEKRDRVYEMLQALLYELDINIFIKLLDKAVTKMSTDEDMSMFYEYFEKYYIDNENYKYWAYCFSINEGVNTNMSLGTFNRVLKYCCQQSIKEECLDKTLCAILNLLKDKVLNLIIEMKKGKLVHKLQVLRKRHRNSLSMVTDNIINLGDKWKVFSPKNKASYIVKRVRDCKSCTLQCSHCDSCFHEFVCSCPDNSVRNNMCKHIHLVARTVNETVNEAKSKTPPNNEDVFIYVMDISENQEIVECVIKNEVVKEETVLNGISVDKKQTNIDQQKVNLLQEFRELENYVQKNITTSQQIDYVRKEIKQMMITIDAMNMIAERNITVFDDVSEIYDGNNIIYSSQDN